MAGLDFAVYRPKSGPRRTILSGMTLEGTEELLSAINAFDGLARQKLAVVLYRRAEEIMTEAKGLTPVDTGNLKASGHVQKPVITDSGVSVTLGFGGPAAPYALPVHERLDVRHRIGQAKFLETPMLAAAKTLEATLAAALRAELRT